MNHNKLSEYQLTGGIHTVAIRTRNTDISDDAELPDGTIKNSTRHKSNGDTDTTSIINANKLYGDIDKYSEFITAFDTIMTESGINAFDMVRADFKLDSFNADHYKRYAKLNRYLISLMATQYRVKNCYKTVNLFSENQLSIAIKNKYIELENYDKHYESDGTDRAYARLEERSKYWNGQTVPDEFINSWSRRWKKALTQENIDKVHKRYNDELERIYKEGIKSRPVRFRSLTDFLIQYQDCIFCKKQMVNLLSRFEEVENPENRAKRHKQRYGIEYFSLSDLKHAVKEIERATQDFFDVMG